MEGKKKMQKYKIFAGLANEVDEDEPLFIKTYKYLETAEQDAWQQACEIYESYAGLHGMRSWQECQEEAEESFSDITEDNQRELDDLTEQIYNDEIESWVSYWVELVEE